jgi:hypothetical protein
MGRLQLDPLFDVRGEKKMIYLNSFIGGGEPPIPGLLAYYPFNGNANDESGNGNNGTVNGATLTTDRKGNANSAYNFDGNDWIALGNVLNITGNNMSVSIWFRFTADGTLMARDNTGARQWVVSITLGRFVLKCFQDNTIQANARSSILTPGIWYHAVGILNEGVVFLWINNIPNTAIQSGSITGIQSTDTPCSIGRQEWSGNNVYITGLIDDIRIYDRVLTEGEITTLYNE